MLIFFKYIIKGEQKTTLTLDSSEGALKTYLHT